jgi:hypothetical protein
LAHLCPVAFFRQMIALKITLLSTIFDGTKVSLDAKVGQSWTQIILF